MEIPHELFLNTRGNSTFFNWHLELSHVLSSIPLKISCPQAHPLPSIWIFPGIATYCKHLWVWCHLHLIFLNFITSKLWVQNAIKLCKRFYIDTNFNKKYAKTLEWNFGLNSPLKFLTNQRNSQTINCHEECLTLPLSLHENRYKNSSLNYDKMWKHAKTI